MKVLGIMIRHVVFFVTLLCIFGGEGIEAQNPVVCRLGFNYEISRSPNWGNGKPVVTGVFPYSSAEQMGLKMNDIIETIDGVPVTSVKDSDIIGMLNPAGKGDVLLTVTNLDSRDKQIMVRKDCKRQNTMTEDQLASAYSMYSLETTSDRLFVCPFTTTATKDTVDFSMFRTFAFAEIDPNNRRLEEVINAAIEGTLAQKGMTLSADDPDILVQTFYFFNKNPNYMGRNKVVVHRVPTYRYNFATKHIERFPFLSHTAAEAEAEYLLQFGLRFVDQRYRKGRVLWECEANELLESAYKLENYAMLHIPLMCMQYPYVKYPKNVQFNVVKKSYNYTGVSYDINKLEVVADVDRSSAAFAAGIRPRDVIMKIDDYQLDHTADEFAAAYKHFILNTSKLRDAKSIFTDANGFRYCMYWEKDKYPEVAHAMNKARYLPAFTYLYKFAPYVDPSAANTCTFLIKRGNNLMEKIIRPTVRTETMISIK